MSEPTTIPTTTAPNSFIMLRAMVGIGIICALLIVLTYEGTKPRIQMLRAEALEQAIFEVLPAITQSAAFIYKDGSFAPLGEDSKADKGPVVYAGYDANDQFVGVAIEGSGQGYAGTIKILYGYDPEAQQVTGFYVLESKETPGLGDKIESDEDFLASVAGLDVQLNAAQTGLEHTVVTTKDGEREHPWQVEGISGATITSRAIGDILASSMSHWAPIIYQRQNDFQR